MKLIIALIVFAACLLRSGHAIKCYQCKSLTDANCAKDVIDATSNIHIVDCDMVSKPNTMDQVIPVTKCNKVITSDKAGIIVSRDCHFEVVGQKPDVCTVSHSREVQNCHICKGDLCNASSAGRLMYTGLAALFGMVVMQFVL
ncbi:uncharacterized protein LOC128863265 [Anastrepha ludens]|uniref:uncharacterized protein LOC128863265 n=1 Tax=Anastrepha ludens TaxID=28586 RepID=UPI0023B17F64|nr:uncharacterized protein LOC128863265 [Anastrepha ludens]